MRARAGRAGSPSLAAAASGAAGVHAPTRSSVCQGHAGRKALAGHRKSKAGGTGGPLDAPIERGRAFYDRMNTDRVARMHALRTIVVFLQRHLGQAPATRRVPTTVP